MGDSALFHIVLVSAAIHLNFVKNDFTSAEVVYHKLKAIQSVNERLRNSPIGVSDDMIHAVVFMAMTEASLLQANESISANCH